MDLFEYFSCVRRLPVKVDDVIEVLQEKGFVFEVHFKESSELPEEALWAFFRSFRPRAVYSNDIPPIIQVVYAEGLTWEEQRLACCKELLHALDEDIEKAATREQVATLIEQMAVPPQSGISLPTINDHLSVPKALIILAPRDALEELRPLVASGKLSEKEVARILELPVEYTRLVLSEHWPKLAEAVLKPVEPR